MILFHLHSQFNRNETKQINVVLVSLLLHVIHIHTILVGEEKEEDKFTFSQNYLLTMIPSNRLIINQHDDSR